MKMRVSDVCGCLSELYEANRSSCFLLGPPGIGKSTATTEAGREMAGKNGKEFLVYHDGEAERILAAPEKYFLYIDFRLTETEPSDLQGIPREVEVSGSIGAVAYYPLLWALCLSKASGLLFLDELTNVQRPDVLSASFKLVLDHRAGFTDFSEGVMVVSAGNSPDDSTLANLLPAPLVDRFIFLDVEKPTIAEWAAWMDATHGNAWDHRTIAYLAQFSDDFLKLPADPEILVNFPTPRSWTNIARILPDLSEKYREAVLVGDLGPEAGIRFLAYCNTQVPDLKTLFANPKQFQQLSLDGKYLAASFCGTWMREQLEAQQGLNPATGFLEVIADERKEFLVLAIVSSGAKRDDVVLALVNEKKLKDHINQIVNAKFAMGG